MRKTFPPILLAFAIVASTAQPTVHAKPQKEQETNYLKKPNVYLEFDVKDPNFKQKVIDDVKASFPKDLEVLKNKDNVAEYTLNDLHKVTLAIGKKDTHLNSLFSLFMGTNYGERRLYIVNGQSPTIKYTNSFIGYLMYKEVDGTNVLKILRRGEQEWEVVEVKEKKMVEHRYIK
jgi:hypothetical protein